MKNKRTILVTGAAGFIGSHLCDRLLLEGYSVIGIDNLRNGSESNLSSASEHSDFTFIKGDILHRNVYSSLIANTDIVFHLACLGVRHSIHSPFENHQVNAEGTLTLLEACRENDIEQFFYISTSEIYGRTDSFPITEKNQTAPLTVYGASKLAGEHYTNAFHECYGMNTTVLRIFNNYGPRAHHEGDSGEIIPRSIVRLLYNEPPVIFGDGSITRDFFYVMDTAKVLASLIGNETISGGTFNVGTGEELSMKTLLSQLVELINPSINITYEADRPADVPRLWVDNTLITGVCGNIPHTPLNEGLQATIDYYAALKQSRNLLNEIKDKNWIK